MKTNYNSEEKKNTSVTPETYLEQAVSSGTKIFIDTCSLLEEYFPIFFDHVKPLLEKYNNRIIVPTKVVKELIRHMDTPNPEKPQLRPLAIKALSLIERYKDSLFRVMGEEGERSEESEESKKKENADNVFVSIYTRFRVQYRMLFITQDRGLAADLLNNNNAQSVRANYAVVKRITPQGYLKNLQVTRENGWWIVPERKAVSVGSVIAQHSKGAFRTCTQPTDIPDERVSLTEVPGEFDTVYAKEPKTGRFAELELGAMIASGGEGAVYETNTKYVAKIYKDGMVTTRRREKVMLMAKKELVCGGISFPVIPLFNSRNEFVGYLMKKAVGEELRTSVFCPIPRFKEKHPDWKREDLVRLCLTILKKIEYLHSMNIIIGDINPGNILVKSPTEVFFVDTDSYQVEDLPCPVGQVNYTAPEIQGKEYGSFLRTMGSENFAIATLLFQILLPGKLPYAHAGGGNQGENIREMNFPYRLGENGNKNEPDGQWKYMWSHLSYAVKEAFYETFQKGGAHAGEDTRLSAADWTGILSRYHKLLTSGKMAENDPMSEWIFPTRPKAGKNASWAVCRHCGDRFPLIEGADPGKGNRMSYCLTCRKTISEIIVCEDCGEEFPVYLPEYESYREKHFEIPKRCPACRIKRKEEKAKRQKAVENKRYGGLEFNQSAPGHQSASEPRRGPLFTPAPAYIPGSPVYTAPAVPKPAAAQRPVPQPVRPAPQPYPGPQLKPAPRPVHQEPVQAEKRGLGRRIRDILIGPEPLVRR